MSAWIHIVETCRENSSVSLIWFPTFKGIFLIMNYFLLECIEHCGGGVSPILFGWFVSLLNFQRASPQFDLLKSLVSGTHSTLWRSGNSEYLHLWIYPWCRCLVPLLLHCELEANAGHCGPSFWCTCFQHTCDNYHSHNFCELITQPLECDRRWGFFTLWIHPPGFNKEEVNWTFWRMSKLVHLWREVSSISSELVLNQKI